MLGSPSQDAEAGFSLGGPATDKDGMQIYLLHDNKLNDVGTFALLGSCTVEYSINVSILITLIISFIPHAIPLDWI